MDIHKVSSCKTDRRQYAHVQIKAETWILWDVWWIYYGTQALFWDSMFINEGFFDQRKTIMLNLNYIDFVICRPSRLSKVSRLWFEWYDFICRPNRLSRMEAMIYHHMNGLNCLMCLSGWWEGRALVCLCKLRPGKRLWLLCPVALTKTDRTNELDRTWLNTAGQVVIITCHKVIAWHSSQPYDSN